MTENPFKIYTDFNGVYQKSVRPLEERGFDPDLARGLFWGLVGTLLFATQRWPVVFHWLTLAGTGGGFLWFLGRYIWRRWVRRRPLPDAVVQEAVERTVRSCRERGLTPEEVRGSLKEQGVNVDRRRFLRLWRRLQAAGVLVRPDPAGRDGDEGEERGRPGPGPVQAVDGRPAKGRRTGKTGGNAPRA